jgi:hypothetical protein
VAWYAVLGQWSGAGVCGEERAVQRVVACGRRWGMEIRLRIWCCSLDTAVGVGRGVMAGGGECCGVWKRLLPVAVAGLAYGDHPLLYWDRTVHSHLFLDDERDVVMAVVSIGPILAGIFLIFLWVMVDLLYTQGRLPDRGRVTARGKTPP